MTAPSRVSNKHILDALNALPTQIAEAIAGVAHTSQAQAPTANEPAPVAQGEGTVQVDEQYLNHMSAKVNDLVANDGQQRVLYTRRNGRGEVKLAYVLADKFESLKDRGLIGAVEICDGA